MVGNFKEKKIITPDEALNRFLSWFNVNKRIAFITAIVVGIITHITMLTDTIMSQDGLWNSMQYSKPGNWEISLGRWGIALIERLNNFIAIPTISTISCILVMAITAVIIVDLFDLKSKISIILTSAILVVAPTFTATLLYIYTSFAYSFNMLIACLAIWFIYKFKYKRIGICLSTLCAMLVLSIYQSYIGITVGLCVMISIIYLIRNEKEIREILINILRAAIAVIVGGILYFIMTKFLLALLNLELTDYKGAGSAGIINTILGLKDSIINAYKDFVAFFLRDRIVSNTNYRREIWYLLFFALSGLIGIANVYNLKTDIKIKKVKIALIIGLIIMLPIALNIIVILVNGEAIYSLTASQMILMVPFCFAIMEISNKLVIAKWFAIASCLCIIGTYYLADNTSYAALKLTYNQAYSTTVRILDRIENTQGYKKDLPILMGGIVGNTNYPRTSNLYGFTIGTMVNNTTFHGTYGGQIGTWTNFIKVFFGLDINFCDANTYKQIISGNEYKEMEKFPEQNSVKIIDGIVVVKLNDDPPLPF